MGVEANALSSTVDRFAAAAMKAPAEVQTLGVIRMQLSMF